MKTKKCKQCGIKKSYDNFYVSKICADGYESKCILCRKEMRRKNEKRIKENRNIIVIIEQVCRVCGKLKSINNFNIASDRKSGYRNECKSCQKIRHADYVDKLQTRLLPKPTYKICHDCKEQKDIIEFAHNSHSRDGYGTQCRSCRKAYHQTLLDKNPDYDRNRNARRRVRPEVKADTKIRNKKWRTDNHEKHLANVRDWQENNKERIREWQRIWSKTESGKRSIRASHANRRNHRKIGRYDILKIEEQNVLRYGVLTCVYCEYPIENINYHLDHVISIVNGGSNAFDNLTISCPFCNLSKRTMTAEEFRKSDRLVRILKNKEREAS